MSPKIFLPGLLTVQICEMIEQIDFNHEAFFVAMRLPLSKRIDSTGRIVKDCSESSGWESVPLADWLEFRLKRKVMLVVQGQYPLDIDDSECSVAVLFAYKSFLSDIQS